MQSNLILHKGSVKVPRESLAGIPVPATTDTYVPIPHEDLVSLVEGNLKDNGLTIVDQQFGLNRKGKQLFGIMTIENQTPGLEYATTIGIRNSHDKQIPAGAALGSRVFVCDNLAFSGEISFARKHTTYLMRDLPELVKSGVTRLIAGQERQAMRFNAYKNTEVDHRDVRDLLFRAMEQKVFPVTKVLDVKAEFDKPQHVEFESRTVWSLFNSITEIIKNNWTDLSDRTQTLHKLCDQFCGIEGQVVRGSEFVQQ